MRLLDRRRFGCFRGLLETRPCMRARADLAGLHADAGRTDEAIAHYEALFDLNPSSPAASASPAKCPTTTTR